MKQAASAQEKIRWDSIEEVPEELRRYVPPIPPRSWTLDVPREQLAKMGPHPDAEARIRAKLELAVAREKLAKQGVPMFMRFPDGSVVRCPTEEETRRMLERADAFRAKFRSEGWDIDQVIREGRDRDPAKLDGGRARVAATAR